MTPGKFLNDLWGSWEGEEGSAVVWLAPGARSIHVAVDDLRVWDAEDDQALVGLTSTKNAYTSPGLRRPGLAEYGKGSQGTQADIVALCGFVLDLDCKGGQHVATNLPATDEDVEALMSVGPDPTRVISTGGGLHFWWLFERPWALPDAHTRKLAKSAYRAFQETFVARAGELGFHVDFTATIQHLFRLPGTRNWKGQVPIEVEEVYAEGPRYPQDELIRAANGSSVSVVAELGVSSAPLPPEEDGLDEVRQWMKRVHPNHKNKTIIEAVIAGESFAEPGKRDTAMQRAVSTIAWLTPARDKAPEDLAELLRPSLSVWAGEPDAAKSLDEEMEKVVEKFERAISEREVKDKENAALLAPFRRFLRIETTGEPADEGVLPNEALADCAIIQYKNSYWAQSFGQQVGYVIKPGFHGPFVQTELLVQLGSLWENAPPQFSVTYFNDDDEEKAKTVLRVTQEYATGAHDVLGHFALQESYFDPATRVFHEAICPVRPLQARYSEEISEWLSILAGPRNADRLLDWIAAVTQLNYQCCALYLAGPPDCGKSLIATGLARLWHVGGATPLENVMANFNAEMFRCPLINLDEGLPDRSFKNASAFLRSLVGSSTHTYNQKNVITRKVVGAIRLLISANNDNVLKFSDEEMSALDLQAVVGRFLHIRVSDDAAKWIAERNAGRRMTDRWVAGDELASHALWLRENRTLDPGRRFLVEGETTAMHKALVTQGVANGTVLEWLARFLTNPVRMERLYKGKQMLARAQVGNQKILINTQGIVDGWDEYLGDNAKKLTTNSVGRVLNQLSDEFKPKMGTNGERIRFHQVDPELVFSWAEENQVGDLEKMYQNLSRQLEEEMVVEEES